jgi:hypothetical protein
MTTIAAVLCWYQEPTEHLNRCVRSLAGTADTLLAVDGAWHPYPNAEPRSHVWQREDIHFAAHETGTDCIVYQTDTVWPSQIAKRAAAVEYAATLADWILVIDADEHIAHADHNELRDQLEHTPHDVAEITVRNITGNDFRNIDRPWRRLFRAHPGLSVRQSHQGYSITDDNSTRWLHADYRAGVTLEPAHDATALLRLHHTPASRSPQRNADAKHYRHLRAAAGER